MDAFFASVEQRDNPELRGKPIAVAGAGERTVITTSSYEARAYGVKTGMTTYEAKRLCPDIILVVGHNEKYAQVCADLQEICLRFTPDTECYSIDEVFLDITGSHHLFDGPEKLARALKTAVRNESGYHVHGRHRAECAHRQARKRPRQTRWLTLGGRGCRAVSPRGSPGEEALGHRIAYRGETPRYGHHHVRRTGKSVRMPCISYD